MTHLAIRQSGGANIISIPKTILKILHLHVGSLLELSIIDNKIVLTPVSEKLTLQDLLRGTPREKLALTNEDKEWLNQKFVGKEF